MPNRGRKPLGVGLGLRWEFLEEVLDGPPLNVAFFEVSPENYMRRGGYYPAALRRIAERYPVVTHGLTLSLGASEAPAAEYLTELRAETESIGTPWHSDHLCLASVGSRILHELVPLAQTRANAVRAAERVRRTRDHLGIPMLVENISWYAHPGHRQVAEADFISEVLERADAGLLLDVNNVWVNAQNHGFDPQVFITSLPLERVREIHIAGHTRTTSGLILDTHGAPVIDPVIELLEWTLELTGPVPVLLERDNHVPELSELLAEVERLAEVYARATRAKEAPVARSA